MSEEQHVRPVNPFQRSDEHAEITHALINAAVETFAFMSAPVLGLEEQSGLIVEAAYEWSKRAIAMGAEDASQTLVWELGVWINRMAVQGVVFPPYDISTSCDNDTCATDHAPEMNMVNAVFMASIDADYARTVKEFTSFVNRWHEVSDWSTARLRGVTALVVHTAERIGQFRSRVVDVMPPLESVFEDIVPPVNDEPYGA